MHIAFDKMKHLDSTQMQHVLSKSLIRRLEVYVLSSTLESLRMTHAACVKMVYILAVTFTEVKHEIIQIAPYYELIKVYLINYSL